MKDLTKSSKKKKRDENQLPNLDVKESSNIETQKLLQRATPGSVVTFNLLQHTTNKTETYTLQLVDHLKSSKLEISIYSPIGKNINNSHVGDIIPFILNFNEFTITILNIEAPF
ncbi:MAG: GreA/GreB family elongation factor [Clostridia bacterium]|nr:GreA/GreB family elongation factor [Clostridia bacterium]MDD4387241.1 GreA/GreB family elongation factor [Clostridia bacterium]